MIPQRQGKQEELNAKRVRWDGSELYGLFIVSREDDLRFDTAKS
jgi:hypothetical protein